MTSKGTTTKRSGLRFKFISETIAELRKAVWLSRREVLYLSTVVLVVAIIVGLILGVIDYAFTRLVDDVFIGSG